MIIEFIGSTGAGKTTLIDEVQRRLARTAGATTSFELVAAKLGLSNIRQTTARNLIQELYGLWYLIRSLPRYKATIGFSLKMIARKAGSPIFVINNFRSLVRKIGIYEILRRQQADNIILVDEGTVLLAHVLFIYNSAYYTPEEIAQFASIVPLPDLIVYVRTPVQNLIERSMRRTDPPRDMKAKNPEQIEKYVSDAVSMFEQLIETEEIRDRVLIVDNPESVNRRSEKAAEFVTEFVLDQQLVPA